VILYYFLAEVLKQLVQISATDHEDGDLISQRKFRETIINIAQYIWSLPSKANSSDMEVIKHNINRQPYLIANKISCLQDERSSKTCTILSINCIFPDRKVNFVNKCFYIMQTRTARRSK